MKFKVGDKVKVIRCDMAGNWCKNIGKIFTILRIDNDNGTHPYSLNGTPEFFGDNELELVKNQFTKSDLKDGDIVTYRNGSKRTVISGSLINENGYISKYLRNYTDELKNTTSGEDLDIVKVERPVKYETMFERKEEILDETEKRYLANVIRPFKNEVRYIVKYDNPLYSGKEYLRIKLKGDEEINFPDFKKDYMYKGMKENKKYTLKELEL